MSSLPSHAAAALDNFDAALSRVEASVSPLFKLPAQELIDQLAPMENAKLNLALSYALNSLFYMYLKTQGASPESHPVKSELDRIRRYMMKTKAAEKELEEKRKVTINKDASKRVIESALSGDANVDGKKRKSDSAQLQNHSETSKKTSKKKNKSKKSKSNSSN